MVREFTLYRFVGVADCNTGDTGEIDMKKKVAEKPGRDLFQVALLDTGLRDLIEKEAKARGYFPSQFVRRILVLVLIEGHLKKLPI